MNTVVFLFLIAVSSLASTIAIPTNVEGQVIRSGPSACQAVALTYDLCPVRNASGVDHDLIDFLITHHVPATFFMSGKWIAKHDAAVKQLLAVPYFEVGTHGKVHAHLPLHDAGEQQHEILTPVTLLKGKYGRATTLFRPPYGEFDDVTVQVVKSLGLQFILWNIESGDPDPTLSADHLLRRLEQRIKPGSVIVLHANGKGKHTRAVTEELTANWLPSKGLRPLTVSDLLTCRTRTE